MADLAVGNCGCRERRLLFGVGSREGVSSHVEGAAEVDFNRPERPRSSSSRRLNRILIVAHVLAVFTVSAAVGYIAGVVLMRDSEPWITCIAAGVGVILWVLLVSLDSFCWFYGSTAKNAPSRTDGSVDCIGLALGVFV